MKEVRVNPRRLILINLAAAFYNLGIQWLSQLDLYPLWRYVPTPDFGTVASAHFLAVCIAVFPAAVTATICAGLLAIRRPPIVPQLALRAAVAVQALLWLLTAVLYGPWQ